MKTPQDYLDIIRNVRPCPAVSGYERAAWLYECRTAARWIAEYTDTEFRRQIAEIEDEGITSSAYKIIPHERQESRVNLDRLRKNHPDIFDSLVYIKASDAQKILGRRTVYQLAREKIGDDAIRDYETVSVGDLEKTTLPKERIGLIDTNTKIMDWEILELEEVNP